MSKYTNINDAISDFNKSEINQRLPYNIRNHNLSDSALNCLISDFDCYESNAIDEEDDVFNKRVFELIENAYMTDYYAKHSRNTMKITNAIIDGEHAIEACKSFLDVNAGDEATEQLILSIFCELFDCSEDLLMEAIN